MIGVGRSGAVRVWECACGTFAVKAIPKSGLPDMQARLRGEVEIGYMAASDFCVPVLGAYETSAHFLLVQPFVPGGDLFSRIAPRALDDGAARFYAANILMGLRFLHGIGVCHLDLKPENVMIDRCGYARIADFGASVRRHAVHDRRVTYGTPEYHAPEVVLGLEVGPHTDMWCVGVLAYDMLVGSTPFDTGSGTLSEMYRGIVLGHFRVPPHVSPAAADFVRSLLVVDPAQRATIERCCAAPWFDGFDWGALLDRRMPPPWRPQLDGADDTRYFETFTAGDRDDVPIRFASARSIVVADRSVKKLLS